MLLVCSNSDYYHKRLMSLRQNLAACNQKHMNLQSAHNRPELAATDGWLKLGLFATEPAIIHVDLQSGATNRRILDFVSVANVENCADCRFMRFRLQVATATGH
jgi:hypothetical protein